VLYDDPGCLQLAPDGKIYLSIADKFWLGVINDPDEAGVNCNFVDSGFNVAPGFSEYGLPNIFPGALQIPVSPESNFAANASAICEKYCTSFLDQSLDSPTLWLWLFPGASPPSSTDQNPINICYTVPGTYDVTLITTNANGADTLTLSNYITVNPTPPSPTITQVGYTLTSSPASSYQWQLNSLDIAGATNQSYDVLQTGLYTVVIGDSNSCKNSASKYVLITGVEDISYNMNVSIYPNPSSGSLTVELLNLENASEVSIDATNTVGQEVFSSLEKITSADCKMRIDLSKTVPGIYFIEIKTENEFVRKRILIER
jgi:PKD repeat protein